MRSQIQILDGPNGGIAQLVERCFCMADVSGSSPLISTGFCLKHYELYFYSSKYELTGDTLVFRSDEGRGYRRNISGSWKQALIRKFPNEETFYTFY